MRLGCAWILLIVGTASMAAAQTAPQAATQPASGDCPSAVGSPATSQPASADPTRPGERLRPFLYPGGPAGARGGPAVEEKPRLPQILRRGFLQADGGKAEALIEIEGPKPSILAIQEGGTLTVSTDRGAILTFRVTKLSRDEIELECVTPDGQPKGPKLIIR